MTNPYERYFHINPLRGESKHGKIVIEMSATGWLLVLYVDDARVVLATKTWAHGALELSAMILEGVAALKEQR